MRMPFWASALAAALIAAAPQGEIATSAGGSISYSADGSKTRLQIRTAGGKHYDVRVERDSTVAPDAPPTKIQLVGEIAGKALILADTYDSAPLGMQYCQAGQEEFLRVITFAGDTASETLHMKLGSCRNNVELADPAWSWNSKTRTLQIHWLEGPDDPGSAEERTIRIGAGGKPE